MHGKKRGASEWSLRSPGGLSVLASAVGGLLTRTLVCSQVECVTENAPVYFLSHANVTPVRLRSGKSFSWSKHFCCSVSQQWSDSKTQYSFLYGLGTVPRREIHYGVHKGIKMHWLNICANRCNRSTFRTILQHNLC